jgi:EAL and modified HD-GYP domain-containing signal transduction protein
MDIYIARQPIFDRYSTVYGYELLYRQGAENCFSGLDDDRATAELLYNSFMVVGLNDLTDGTLAFINFSKNLVETDIPYLLPPSKVVVEVLERSEATEATIEACKKLRSKGYKVALDDFIPSEENFRLFECADIIKVEYPAVSHTDQQNLIKKYGMVKTFLAEKIETREDYEAAARMGYNLFQGYFFSKPALIGTREIRSLNVNIFHVLEELKKTDPNFDKISGFVQCDLGLAYKLLRLVNSVYYGPVHGIRTIRHALTHLGLTEMRKWFSILMLKDLQTADNSELIKLSLIRGKLMELLAEELHDEANKPDYFFTGVFSFINVLLGRPMGEILNGLPISDKIKRALLGEDNEYRKLLDFVAAGEQMNWDGEASQQILNQIGAMRYMTLYVQSLKWINRLGH